jgi:hypothetical protein
MTMKNDEKTATIAAFHRAAGQAQKEIETGMDDWLEGTGTEAFDRLLLELAELALRLLRLSLDKRPTS